MQNNLMIVTHSVIYAKYVQKHDDLNDNLGFSGAYENNLYVAIL